tara:strand:+ start:138 stop:815 length:678 start_codon:yes stop_codon:yes gene_type:complete
MGRMKEEFMQMQEEMQYNLQPKESINQMKLQEQEYARDIMEKHHPIGQERYVDEAEYERNKIIDAMYDVAQQPSINQINNKVKKVNKVEEATMVKETKEETLKRLFLANGLVKEDVHKDPRGFVIIKRSGIDKIVSRQNIQVAYEPVTMTPEWVVLRATASMRTGTGEHDVRNMMSFGEASDSNLMGGAKKFPVAMAEKRAMSRVVLKIAGFYEQGVFGQDEMAD